MRRSKTAGPHAKDMIKSAAHASVDNPDKLHPDGSLESSQQPQPPPQPAQQTPSKPLRKISQKFRIPSPFEPESDKKDMRLLEEELESPDEVFVKRKIM